MTTLTIALGRRAFLRGLALVSALVCAVGASAGQQVGLTLNSLFADDMVLQRGVRAPVWGTAPPGVPVVVSIAGATTRVVAGSDGRWSVRIGPLAAGGPHDLTADAGAAGGRIVLHNVLVGDVWICSGQSNMEWPLVACRDGDAAIATSSNPNLRLFAVRKDIAYAPRPALNPREGDWQNRWFVSSPETSARMSGVGYYFARKLQKELGVPIGLIHTSWGGTLAEAWTSGEALSAMPDFRGAVTGVRQAAEALTQGSGAFTQKLEQWWKGADPGSKADYEKLAAAGTDWKTMALPASWESAGLPDYDGAVWFLREVDVPAGSAGKAATLRLGPIDDDDTTWVNGVRVGDTAGYNIPRAYKVAAGVLRAGRNVIAVRVLDTAGDGGINGKPDELRLAFDGGDSIPLAGDWRYQATAPIAKLGGRPIRADNNPNTVTVLYNGMVAPLVPFAIKGAIWYQGESNADRAMQYRTLLPTMINDWRARFGVGPFPFYIVQLANFLQTDAEPRSDPWPELREAQALVSQTLRNTGLAVAIDIGEANDIHPRNKLDVGERLALNALGQTYGQKITWSGPVYRGMKLERGSIRVSFSHADGGLKTPDGGTVKGFALAGADGVYHWADARIDGGTVVVSSSSTPAPVNVRYAWANNPVCNLQNGAGLPAVPFRSDAPTTAVAGRK